MKKRLAVFTAAVILLTGCSNIDYENIKPPETNAPITTPQQTENPEETEPPVEIVENKADAAEITPEDFSQVIQAEDNLEKTEIHSDALSDFDGDGYIALLNYSYATVTVDVPSSQHYKISIACCAEKGIVTLMTNGQNIVTNRFEGYETRDGTTEGAYYVSGDVDFQEYSLDGIYLQKGKNLLTLQGLSGIVMVDYIKVENSSAIDDSWYKASSSPVSPSPNAKTVNTMNFLSDTYGKKILMAQYCTINTNAEIRAIYDETGRRPAIRCGDLSHYSLSYGGADKEQNKEIELSAEWAENGGIVSLSWLWYAPTTGTSDYEAEKTDFKLDNAVTENDISLNSAEEIRDMLENGEISDSCYNLIVDLDNIAQQLKILDEKDVTVLWRPLMEAGNGWYWWGDCAAESYKWLWKLMVKRFTQYHKLGNLIWVWNGESYDFYPGDDYVDIVSEDVYNETDSTNQIRFRKAAGYSTNRNIITALSECMNVPNPDALARDNSMWMWIAVYRGDYLINSDGTLNESFTSNERLNFSYNHELTLTLDELPDMESYSVETG